eukprot:3885869-Alexandrium_andersonii.AAC.1
MPGPYLRRGDEGCGWSLWGTVASFLGSACRGPRAGRERRVHVAGPPAGHRVCPRFGPRAPWDPRSPPPGPASGAAPPGPPSVPPVVAR